MRIRAVSFAAFPFEKISAGLAMAVLALISVVAGSLQEELADQSPSFRGFTLLHRAPGPGVSSSSTFPGL